jgi:hypothetical protein
MCRSGLNRGAALVGWAMLFDKPFPRRGKGGLFGMRFLAPEAESNHTIELELSPKSFIQVP